MQQNLRKYYTTDYGLVQTKHYIFLLHKMKRTITNTFSKHSEHICVWKIRGKFLCAVNTEECQKKKKNPQSSCGIPSHIFLHQSQSLVLVIISVGDISPH